MSLKSAIKGIIPKGMLKKIRPIGHGFLARVASLRYGNPSSQMIVIGVTGTAGKSTTIQMLAELLRAGGMRTGYVTTAGRSDGGELKENPDGLSMPGGFAIQNALVDMLDAKCAVAIVECTSEGLAQNRHLGIDFDMALLTNLHAAHLEAHGGMEGYRKAKGRLFAALSRSPRKSRLQKKVIGVNAMAEHAPYFTSFAADEVFAVIDGMSDASIAKGVQAKAKTMFAVEDVHTESDANGERSRFRIADTAFEIPLPGEFNVWNAALAIAAAKTLGIELDVSAKALATFGGVPGRMQEIPNDRGLKIIIDYAPEPVAMEESLRAVQAMRGSAAGRIIHVFGSTGGHRDAAKRAEFGRISAARADMIIVTNDDVYDSDPQKIADDILVGITDSQKAAEDTKTELLKHEVS